MLNNNRFKKTKNQKKTSVAYFSTNNLGHHCWNMF